VPINSLAAMVTLTTDPGKTVTPLLEPPQKVAVGGVRSIRTMQAGTLFNVAVPAFPDVESKKLLTTQVKIPSGVAALTVNVPVYEVPLPVTEKVCPPQTMEGVVTDSVAVKVTVTTFPVVASWLFNGLLLMTQ
jgi:hypothetical protein